MWFYSMLAAIFKNISIQTGLRNIRTQYLKKCTAQLCIFCHVSEIVRTNICIWQIKTDFRKPTNKLVSLFQTCWSTQNVATFPRPTGMWGVRCRTAVHACTHLIIATRILRPCIPRTGAIFVVTTTAPWRWTHGGGAHISHPSQQHALFAMLLPACQLKNDRALIIHAYMPVIPRRAVRFSSLCVCVCECV